MTINISAADAMSAMAPMSQRPNSQKMLQPVADLLGTSVDDIRKAQRSGTTLDQMASAKGVSHADLVTAIKKGLQDTHPTTTAGSTSSTATDPLNQMAEDIAAGRRPQGTNRQRRVDADGDHDGDTAAADKGSALESLSSSLKMSSTDLVTALKSGTSLTDLASSQGVNANDVLNAVGKGLVLKTYA